MRPQVGERFKNYLPEDNWYRCTERHQSKGSN
ncbi:hypothetical protein HMPREF1219_01502 [Corynebacterium pyruviciproducens ATCC BAA-1742]|uniref:Uncharacterized protein n=1 Tax=Corynebacterium pyruviciproducens ATCC BAA-1742 TaxID=1125779 RepID=S2ZGY5_9CORY|nr:hypothetical protein HMPREF1219_01502 [Corynebacterium pyruviciproducens ATCC BAA-1742]